MDETLVSGGYWCIPLHNLEIYACLSVYDVGWTKSHISHLLVTNIFWALYVGSPLLPLAHAFVNVCGPTSFDTRACFFIWLTLCLLTRVPTVE